MTDLFKHEQDKYNSVHQYTGIHEGQAGYGRQLGLLLNDSSKFHKIWQEEYSNGASILEIGLGAGEIVKHFHKEGREYAGVDISDWVVKELKKEGINAFHMSCHELDIEDDSYDIVQHLDGMEHIPINWELETLKEELRVAKKYVFHANAMGTASLDSVSKQNGFDAVHINIKTEAEWRDFYESNQSLGYEIFHQEMHNGTYKVVLKKTQK